MYTARRMEGLRRVGMDAGDEQLLGGQCAGQLRDARGAPPGASSASKSQPVLQSPSLSLELLTRVDGPRQGACEPRRGVP